MDTILTTVTRNLEELEIMNEFIQNSIPEEYDRISNLYQLKQEYQRLIDFQKSFIGNLEWHKKFYKEHIL
jgi:hypothetical protein